MRICISRKERKAVIVPAGESHLQAIIVRFINIPHLVDETEEWKSGIEGATGLLVSSGIERRDVLVDIADTGELGTVVAHIGCFQSDLRIESMLHVQVPNVDIGSFEILRDSHNRARTAGRRTAIDGASREYRAAADVVPVQR